MTPPKIVASRLALSVALSVTPLAAAFAHPHHDAATNLSHSHFGEVAVVGLVAVVALVVWRRSAATVRNHRD